MKSSSPTTIAAAARSLERGELRSLELVEACLARIEQLDGQLRAWVLVDGNGARAEARRADEEIAAGKYRGPLHGIPLGIKDICDVAGMPTRCGSSLTDGASVAEAAVVVAQLRAAGAIVLGKTVTTEYACFDPPPTRNPWNVERTPGGSSSGSAVAVATGMCVGAVGSQTGGSITRPAAYCGVAGLKPTFGRVSRQGVAPVSDRLDHVGPLARSVGDLRLLLAAMQEEFCDPFTGGASGPPQIGLVEGFFLEQASDEVTTAVRAALQQLIAAGAEVRLVSLPESFAEVQAMHRRIMAVEAAAVHESQYAARWEQYGKQLASLLEEGIETEPAAYQVALAHQQRFAQEISNSLQGFDVLLTPATPTTAPGRESTGDPRFNSPWSYTGLPTVNFPCALSADRLPVGIQLIGRAWDDDLLLSVAEWCEAAIGFDAQPPLAAS